MEKNYYTIKEASNLVKVSGKTLRKYIRKGIVKATLERGHNGNEYHIKIEELERFKQVVKAGKLELPDYKGRVGQGIGYNPAYIIDKLEAENKRLREQLREREEHIAKLQVINIKLNEEVLKRLPLPEPHKEKTQTKNKVKKWYEFWK